MYERELLYWLEKKKKKQEKASIRLHFVYLSIESKVDQKLKIPLSA